MRPNEEHERWLTARHEAGHAVAALHYNCPIAYTSIEGAQGTRGTTPIPLEEHREAIVIFCGPLAENDWEVYVPGTVSREIPTLGNDERGLRILADRYGDLQCCFQEALRFITQRPVQEQIDRVAGSLLARTRLTEDEVREVAKFSEPLSSPAWR